MRLRLRPAGGLALGALFFGLVAACGFGVDLDNLFTGSPDASRVEAGTPKMQVVQLAGGDGFTCGRRVDGTVMCWGKGDFGQLGAGSEDATSVPQLVKEITDAVDLSVGMHHGCVVRRSGAVSCWGNNNGRQLGDGTTTQSTTPKNVLTIASAKQVAAGENHSCALLADGTVRCWGANDSGQLGDGTTRPLSTPVPVTGLADVAQIAVSRGSSCAVLKSGDVYCWGENGYGQAGVEASDDVRTPTKIASLSGVTAIGPAGTAYHFCAVMGSGEVRCWGLGRFGALGNGWGGERMPVPASAIGVNDAVQVSTGLFYSCVARKSGMASCWGTNAWRQLGVGDTDPPDNVVSPVTVAGPTGVQQVSTGTMTACALLEGGQRISCWGSNRSGGLGRSTPVMSDVPLKVAAPVPFASISVGADYACAVDEQGALYCWGGNESNQLIIPKMRATGTPTKLDAISGVSKVGAGENHTCAVVGGGEIRCWGAGDFGQLGNGADSSSSAPVVYGAGSGTDVGSGSSYTCALLASGQVACAGTNIDARLGRPDGASNSPVLVLSNTPDPDAGADGGATMPLSGATHLRVGTAKACAIRGGTLTCWGSTSDGRRGPGAGSGLPSDVPLGARAIDVTGDGDHTCVVLQGGAVQCWGRNDYGQTTGAGATGPTIGDVDLGGKTAKAIAAGYVHTCAVVDDGTVRCWGRGTHGEVGNGIRGDAPTPVVVKGLANVKAISAYNRHTCALTNDGAAWCWGDNSVGQLGDGSPMTTGTPAPVVDY